MSPDLAQREVAIAAIALLAAVLGLALGSRDGGSSAAQLPEAIPAPDGGWYHARAAASGRDLEPGSITECGHRIMGGTIGVGHAVLPCGVKLYVGHGDEEILTQVIARGREAVAPELQFGLTDSLARELDIDDPATIRYRFAR